MKTLLEALIAELGLSQKLAECRALLAWEEVAGPALAARARPLRLRRGRLELAVPAAVWRTQLSFACRDLVRRLNAHLGEEIVKELVLLNQR